ncbi:hypothetical protein H8959_007757 [Pygathrix nigripes]
MSTAMNFGTKSFQPRPPDKGSFPLDHLGHTGVFRVIYVDIWGRKDDGPSQRCGPPVRLHSAFGAVAQALPGLTFVQGPH